MFYKGDMALYKYKIDLIKNKIGVFRDSEGRPIEHILNIVNVQKHGNELGILTQYVKYKKISTFHLNKKLEYLCALILAWMEGPSYHRLESALQVDDLQLGRHFLPRRPQATHCDRQI